MITTEPSCELHVLWHDGHTLGMDGAEVGILEEPNEVSLGSLLECTQGIGLEPEVTLETLGNLSDEPLEGELPDQEVG